MEDWDEGLMRRFHGDLQPGITSFPDEGRLVVVTVALGITHKRIMLIL